MGSSTVRGTRVHQARVPFCIGPLNYLNIPYSLNFLKPNLPTFPQLTLSSLIFSISLSLSQSCYQLTLTFSISLSNSPTRSQSPFQSPSRSRSVAQSPSCSVAHALGLPLALHLQFGITRYVSLSLHLQFEHWVFVGICGYLHLLLFASSVCCLLFVSVSNFILAFVSNIFFQHTGLMQMLMKSIRLLAFLGLFSHLFPLCL